MASRAIMTVILRSEFLTLRWRLPPDWAGSDSSGIRLSAQLMATLPTLSVTGRCPPAPGTPIAFVDSY